ncbi:MAG: hypothetical protein HYV26_12455 [Candidatus Hydrogenedentes bacterium]|nr:hypothetical protein [Candidatus Hydrogenedentota bacterium]
MAKPYRKLQEQMSPERQQQNEKRAKAMLEEIRRNELQRAARSHPWSELHNKLSPEQQRRVEERVEASLREMRLESVQKAMDLMREREE